MYIEKLLIQKGIFIFNLLKTKGKDLKYIDLSTSNPYNEINEKDFQIFQIKLFDCMKASNTTTKLELEMELFLQLIFLILFFY